MYGKPMDRETPIVLEGEHNVQDGRANKHTCPTPRRKATVILFHPSLRGSAGLLSTAGPQVEPAVLSKIR